MTDDVENIGTYSTGDPENCHIFYQCEINPAPMSCGDMMFNTDTQVGLYENQSICCYEFLVNEGL